jgi:hypothetical protein
MERHADTLELNALAEDFNVVTPISSAIVHNPYSEPTFSQPKLASNKPFQIPTFQIPNPLDAIGNAFGGAKRSAFEACVSQLNSLSSGAGNGGGPNGFGGLDTTYNSSSPAPTSAVEPQGATASRSYRMEGNLKTADKEKMQSEAPSLGVEGPAASTEPALPASGVAGGQMTFDLKQRQMLWTAKDQMAKKAPITNEESSQNNSDDAAPAPEPDTWILLFITCLAAASAVLARLRLKAKRG